MPASDKKYLSVLLQQIRFEPVSSPGHSKPIIKITKVEKGSMWEKEGFQAGDLVYMGPR